jgi:hypothetical protein
MKLLAIGILEFQNGSSHEKYHNALDYIPAGPQMLISLYDTGDD